MKRLCAAVTPQDRETDLTVSCAVDWRLEEYQMFERNKEHLLHLCSQLYGDVQGDYDNFNTANYQFLAKLLFY